MRLLLSLVLLIFACGAARADSAQERARSLNRKAMTQYDLGHYDEALKLFQRAYETYSDPKVLFNLAQTYRKAGNHQRALESYRAYLRDMPAAPNRAVVEERIAEIEQLLDAQRASDAKPPEGLTPAPPPPPPVAAPAPAPPPRDTAPSRRWYRDGWGWTLAGAGLAAAVTGTVLLVHAQGQKDDLAVSNESERDGLRDSIRRNQLLGGIGLGLGAGLVAGAVVKFVLSERSSNEVSVAVSGNALFVSGRF